MAAFGFWALFMVLLVIATGAETYRALRARKMPLIRWRNWILYPFASLIVALPMAGGIGIFAAGMTSLYFWARAPETSELLVLWAAAPFTLFVGGVAFLIRLRLRLVYGVTEVAVGLFVAWAQVRGGGANGLLSGSFLLAFTTAAVYLVVRGLDNVHQGWKAEAPDPVARLLKSRLGARASK